MRSELHKPTLGALRARRQGWRIAMGILYPRLRVKPQRVARALSLDRTIHYEPGPVHVVTPRDNLFTALAAVAVLAMILGLLLLLSRLM